MLHTTREHHTLSRSGQRALSWKANAILSLLSSFPKLLSPSFTSPVKIKPVIMLHALRDEADGGEGTDPFASQKPSLTTTSASSQVRQKNHRNMVSIPPHRAHFTESPPRLTPTRGRNIFVCRQQKPSKAKAGRAELQYQLSAIESQLCPRYRRFFLKKTIICT